MTETLAAPFSYFGNKRPIADIVWTRLGKVDFYSEPFFGSGGVFFARPNPDGVEIVNDKEGLLVNAWRSMVYNPEETARLALEFPPTELEIIARHRWLMEKGRPQLEKLKEDPYYHVPLIGAWYIYGMATYVGGGWCAGESYKNQDLKIPKVSGEGIFRSEFDGDPEKVAEYFKKIQYRMRNTKIANGDWSRVVTPVWTTGNQGKQVAGIFLDPPYEDAVHSIKYSAGGDVAFAVRNWCLKNGDNPNLRIALAGYESDKHKMPDTWETYKWKASGGYGNQGNGQGRENAYRERIWFSPHCLKPGLFQYLEEVEATEQEQIEVVSSIDDEGLLPEIYERPLIDYAVDLMNAEGLLETEATGTADDELSEEFINEVRDILDESMPVEVNPLAVAVIEEILNVQTNNGLPDRAIRFKTRLDMLSDIHCSDGQSLMTVCGIPIGTSLEEHGSFREKADDKFICGYCVSKLRTIEPKPIAVTKPKKVKEAKTEQLDIFNLI